MVKTKKNHWKVTVITTMPEIFPGPLNYSNVGKALDSGLWSLELIQIEKHKNGKKIKIDGPPAGGGPGMVMRADAVIPIIKKIKESGDNRPIIVPAARGMKYNQKYARKLIKEEGIIIICSRFEGIDQRIIDITGAIEMAIGDFILTNGDIAAINIIDSSVRLLDGVLNKKESTYIESYENDLLEHPHYTLPREYEGHQIPEILLSGDHDKIKLFRKNQSIQTTENNRPDLIKKYRKNKD